MESNISSSTFNSTLSSGNLESTQVSYSDQHLGILEKDVTVKKLDYYNLAKELRYSSLIAYGGFGCVYHVKYNNQDCACKHQEFKSEDNRDQILYEIQSLANCEHQNIVPVIGYAINNSESSHGDVLILMKFGGISLKDFINIDNRPDNYESREIEPRRRVINFMRLIKKETSGISYPTYLLTFRDL